MEKTLFRFLKASPMSPPGFLIGICVPSRAEEIFGKLAIPRNFLIIALWSGSNLQIPAVYWASALETRLMLWQTVGWEIPLKSAVTV